MNENYYVVTVFLNVASQGPAKAGHFKLFKAPLSAVASLTSGCFIATSLRGAFGSAVMRALCIAGESMLVMEYALAENIDVNGTGVLVKFQHPPPPPK